MRCLRRKFHLELPLPVSNLEPIRYSSGYDILAGNRTPKKYTAYRHNLFTQHRQVLSDDREERLHCMLPAYHHYGYLLTRAAGDQAFDFPFLAMLPILELHTRVFKGARRCSVIDLPPLIYASKEACSDLQPSEWRASDIASNQPGSNPIMCTPFPLIEGISPLRSGSG